MQVFQHGFVKAKSLNSIHFRASGKTYHLLVGDIGRTNTRLSIADINDSDTITLRDSERKKTPKLFRNIPKVLKAYLKRHDDPEIDAVALGVAGRVQMFESTKEKSSDWKPKGKVHISASAGTYPHIPTDKDTRAPAQTVELGEGIHKSLQLPATILNDADAFLLGETTSEGAFPGATNIVGLTLGTGLGSAMVYSGQLQHYQGQSLGEAGGMVIEPDSFLNNRNALTGYPSGRLSQYISGKGFWKMVQHELLDQMDTAQTNLSPHEAMSLAYIGAQGRKEEGNQRIPLNYSSTKGKRATQPSTREFQPIGSNKVIELTSQSYRTLQRIYADAYRRWHTYIALGITNILTQRFVPNVVIGGSLAKYVDYKRVNGLARWALTYPDEMTSQLEIKPGKLGDEAAQVGAAYWFKHNPFMTPEKLVDS